MTLCIAVKQEYASTRSRGPSTMSARDARTESPDGTRTIPTGLVSAVGLPLRCELAPEGGADIHARLENGPTPNLLQAYGERVPKEN